MRTAVHVTHEAVRKVGGIGAVLEGLITSPSYRKKIRRTILVGPLFSPLDEHRLASEGAVLYSSISGLRGGQASKGLDEVVLKYNVDLVYGKRRLLERSSGESAEVEVVLVDPTYLNPRTENNFKLSLYRRFGLQSDRYEGISDYLLYLRIAEPAYDAAAVLLSRAQGPHFVLAHEFMGMPTALKAILADDPRFRSVFHAHEVATMRALVENSPGHDIMFYNVLDEALERGLSVSDVFGDQSGYYRHALIARSHFCDGLFAVGDHAVKELRFLGPEFADRRIDLVYNGVPSQQITLEEKLHARELLRTYAENLLGVRPDYVFTHVTRMVLSKGLWRDIRVLEHLDDAFADRDLSGVFFVLSNASHGGRETSDVLRMEAEYGWPVAHRSGYPDLIGPEVDFWTSVNVYNRRAKAIRVVFVNQFGWNRENCGTRMPADMSFADLRRGTDVEFGQSVYEPFGIAQLEPLCFGGLCVVSNVCGCLGLVTRTGGVDGSPNVIVADYVHLREPADLDAYRRLGAAERDRVESERGRGIAEEILMRLPSSDEERETALEEGQRVAATMSWDRVCTDFFLPGLERAGGGGSTGAKVE